MHLDLDNIEAVKLADPDGYLDILSNTPAEIEKVRQTFAQTKYKWKKFDKVVVCAMGGSAIGADMAKFIIEKYSHLPMQIIRDYNLPNWVDENTLALVLSYSGNTEESISGYLAARQKNAQIFVVAAGGKLIELAKENKNNFLLLPPNYPPRTTWGMFFFTVLDLMIQTDHISPDILPLEQAIAGMQAIIQENGSGNPADHNPAKTIARQLTDSIPVVFGAEHLASVASRWKKEFNENSKIISLYDEIPELNHNLQQGLECQEKLKQAVTFIILSSPLYHPRNLKRSEIIQTSFTEQNFAVMTVPVKGQTYLESIVNAVLVGTYASVYLAFLLGKNPVPFIAIEKLKAELQTEEYIDSILSNKNKSNE